MTEKKKRGFAAMDPERLREVARMGGAAVPIEKRGFSQHRDLAVRAGRAGGIATPPEKRIFSTNPDYAVECGRRSAAARKAKRENPDAVD